MKTTKIKKPAVAALTLQEIDALVAEIADYQLTCDGLQTSINEKFRLLNEALAPIKAAAMPEIEHAQTVLATVTKSLDERWKVVEAWAEAHKADRFEQPRSIKLLRGVIGFRLTPSKLSAMKGWTMAQCAAALKRRLWGRDFLHQPKIDHEAVIKARVEFEAKPARLAAVGLQITQDDVFYIEAAQEGSDAFGKGAA